MSDINILKLCAAGASVSAIAEFFDLCEDDVRDTLKKHFEFGGWEENLIINPLRLYNTLEDTSKEAFFAIIEDWKYAPETAEDMYRAVSLVTRLERILDENWI